MPITAAELPRLRQALALLPPSEATWIADMVEPTWARYQRRLTTRDDAIRQAVALMGASNLTAATEELGRTLKRYLSSSGWKADAQRGGPPHEAPNLHALLFAIASGNNGKPIGQKQLYRIAKGRRTPFA